MKFFSDNIIKPYIKESRYQKILEIGASLGRHSEEILRIEGVELTIIDPCLDCDLAEKFRANDNVKVLKGLSLQVLPELSEPFDCIFIDGDHNWYTVTNELKVIEKQNLLKEGGTVFFHDVAWPYGRRDMYYVPESIPTEFRHAFAQKGMARGQSSLVDDGGTNKDLFNAEHEGGPKNGVLTAILDFVKEHSRSHILSYDIQESGLGMMVKKKDLITLVRSYKWFMRIFARNHYVIMRDFLLRRYPALSRRLISIKHYLKSFIFKQKCIPSFLLPQVHELKLKKWHIQTRHNLVNTVSYGFSSPGHVECTFIIPHKDCADFVRLCVESIKCNTKTIPYEILIADDFSDEAEFQGLKQLAAPGIRIHRFKKGKGHSFVLEWLYHRANSPYVVVLDQDSLLLSGRWEELFQEFDKNKKLLLMGINAATVHSSPSMVHPSFILVNKARCDKELHPPLFFGKRPFYEKYDVKQTEPYHTLSCKALAYDPQSIQVNIR